MSKKAGEKKETLKEDDLKRIEEMREAKRRKKELKEQQERERKRREEQALIDKEVEIIYKSGLADAYKCNPASTQISSRKPTGRTSSSTSTSTQPKRSSSSTNSAGRKRKNCNPSPTSDLFNLSPTQNQL